MKVNIRPHVEFCIDGNHDLYLSIRVDHDEYFIEKIKLEEILKKQLRGLSKADKKDCKMIVTTSIKKFLAFLESEWKPVSQIPDCGKNKYSRNLIIYDELEGVEIGGWFDKRFGWMRSDGCPLKSPTHWREMILPPDSYEIVGKN